MMSRSTECNIPAIWISSFGDILSYPLLVLGSRVLISARISSSVVILNSNRLLVGDFRKYSTVFLPLYFIFADKFGPTLAK
jgi:hypothetical protein